jgi:hypothetical protein
MNRGEPPAPTRGEWGFAIALALLALLLSSLPYVFAAAVTPDDQVYNGFVINAEDGYTYLAKMQQGARGAWRFRVLFTSEPHEPIVTYLFYIALGHLAHWLSLELLFVLNVARITAGFVLLLVIFRFIASFFTEAAARRLAFFLAVFASGLGWFAVLVAGDTVVGELTPVDFWLIEMYTFFTIMLFPHFSSAVLLILLVFWFGLRYLETEKLRIALVAAASAVLLSTIHPFMLLVVDATLGLFWLQQTITRRRLWWEALPGLLVLGLAPLPLVAVQFMGLRENSVMVGWQAQNHSLSPPPPYYILGYGVLLVLALPGAWWAWQQRARDKMSRRFSWWPLLPLWLLVVAVLLYAPVVYDLQRRFIEGAHVPVAMLATVGLRRVVKPAVASSRFAGGLAQRGYGRQRLAGFTGLLLVALTLPSTLLLLGQAFALAIGEPKLRFSNHEVAAVTWLEASSDFDAAVISSYEIGGYVPAFSGRRSFMGHWTETVDLETKRELAAAYYAGEEGEELLFRYHIDYVFYGPREKAMGTALDNPPAYLEPVFSSGDVTLFRVEK